MITLCVLKKPNGKKKKKLQRKKTIILSFRNIGYGSNMRKKWGIWNVCKFSL